MIVTCPHCHEKGLTYRYDEVYCIICSHRQYTVPKELQDFANAQRRLQIKSTKSWREMRNRSKYAMKAVRIEIRDVSSPGLRHTTPHKEERR